MRTIASYLAIIVFWISCSSSWTAILAIIDARQVTTLDNCVANSGMCGAWIMIGGFAIGSTMIIVGLILHNRCELNPKQKRKNVE